MKLDPDPRKNSKIRVRCHLAALSARRPDVKLLSSSNTLDHWTTVQTLTDTKTTTFFSVHALFRPKMWYFFSVRTIVKTKHDTRVRYLLHVFLISSLFSFLFQFRDHKIPSFASFCVLLMWGSVVPHTLLFFPFFSNTLYSPLLRP